MIKFLFVGRRAPGTTRTAALAHLRDVHGRMVVCPPKDAGAMPAYYAQNHVIDGAYPTGDGDHSVERDLVTHLEFDSFPAMTAAVATDYYKQSLQPDEPRFVDDATVAKLNVTPRQVVDGARTTHKLFILTSRAQEATDPAWASTRETMTGTIAGWNGLVALIDNEVLAPPVGRRFVDVVFEAWFADRYAALAAARDATGLFGGAGVDATASLVIVAEEFTQERLRSLIGC